MDTVEPHRQRGLGSDTGTGALLATSRYGAVGAGAVWCLYNVAYAIVVVRLMHRRILPGQQWRWYVEDVGLPVLAAVGAAALMRALVASSSIPMLVVQLVLAGAFVQFVTCATVPDIRRFIFGFIQGVGGGKVVQ